MLQRSSTTTTDTWTHDGATRDECSFCVLVSCATGVSVVPLPPRDALVIGRKADADIVVRDRSVSHRHAILRLKHSMTIEDLGSRNGTRVQGVQLRPGEVAPVGIGSVLELGDATLLLERPRTEMVSTELPAGQPAHAAAGPAPCLVHDQKMKRLYALLDVIAPTSLPVLIMGETGVGKEMFARAVHAQSTRRGKPMLTLNCGALPDSILEGELFGYEKAAFTGASQARPGLFESATGGSVFLDEIGELAPSAQSKLLRVLENGEVLRLGARHTTRVDVRFITATNRDLRFLVSTGAFRSDLFFRLNGMTITLPPLRDRKAEIRPLAIALLEHEARQLGRKAPTLGDDAIAALEDYSWPGNIRELRTTMQRAAVLCEGATLTSQILEEVLDPAVWAADARAPAALPRPAAGACFRDAVRDIERQRIIETLEACGGNQSRAAAMLGIPRLTFVKRLGAYDIGRPRKPADSR